MPQWASRNSLRIPGVRAIGNVAAVLRHPLLHHDPLVSAGASTNCVRAGKIPCRSGQSSRGAMEDFARARTIRHQERALHVLRHSIGRRVAAPGLHPTGQNGPAAPANMSSWREFNACIWSPDQCLRSVERSDVPYLVAGLGRRDGRDVQDPPRRGPGARPDRDRFRLTPRPRSSRSGSTVLPRLAWKQAGAPRLAGGFSQPHLTRAPQIPTRRGNVKRASVLQGIVAAAAMRRSRGGQPGTPRPTTYLGKAKSRRMQQV